MAGFPPVNWLEWAGELIGITIVVVGLMIASIIYLMSNSLFTVTRFGTNYLNRVFSYQVTTLALSLVIILIIALLTRFQSLRLLSVTRIDGEVHPEPWIGISTRNKDTWKTLGRNMAIVISIVTAIAIYFQVYRNGVIQSLTLGSFLLILVYALTNSFVEEVTFRHTFASIVEYHNLNPYLSKALSALIFGSVHYLGTPGKIPGVLLAGFLGWFLSKSIHETKGFFWAWLIHFLQDVIIMTALFLTLP